MKNMYISVSGGRTFNDYVLLDQIMNHYKPWISHVNVGGAKGLDTLVERWCITNNIPFTVYKPQYQNSNDRGAPLRRNFDIVNGTSFLIAFPTSESRGTYDAINKAKNLNIPVYIHNV